MSVTESGKPPAVPIGPVTFFTTLQTTPEIRQLRHYPSASSLSIEDTMLAQACSHVACAIIGYHVGLLEEGGVCVTITVAAQPGESEIGARWLIWRDRGRLLARQCDATRAPDEHASMQDALQRIAALSADDMRSTALLAKAMLLSQSIEDEPMSFAMAA